MDLYSVRYSSLFDHICVVCVFIKMPGQEANRKRKREVLTFEKKVEIIMKLDKGESVLSLTKQYNVGKSTVYDLKMQRSEILEFASQLDSQEGSSKRKTMRGSEHKKLDEAVYLWFTQRRSRGEPISGPLICEKAL